MNPEEGFLGSWGYGMGWNSARCQESGSLGVVTFSADRSRGTSMVVLKWRHHTLRPIDCVLSGHWRQQGPVTCMRWTRIKNKRYQILPYDNMRAGCPSVRYGWHSKSHTSLRCARKTVRGRHGRYQKPRQNNPQKHFLGLGAGHPQASAHRIDMVSRRWTHTVVDS